MFNVDLQVGELDCDTGFEGVDEGCEDGSEETFFFCGTETKVFAVDGGGEGVEED
jgi:hypothetical protein